MPVWEPEIVVDEALVRRLLRQFPELQEEPIRLFANGWDYTVWAVGERYAFRFPRRAVGKPASRAAVDRRRRPPRRVWGPLPWSRRGKGPRCRCR